MSRSQVESIHLSFLEDVLPVGMAIVERAKKGGARQVVEVFTGSEKPIELLRLEGASSALLIRQKLDKIRPGLGNPILEVEVSLDPPDRTTPNCADDKTLVNILRRIDTRIDAIQNHLEKSIDLNS